MKKCLLLITASTVLAVSHVFGGWTQKEQQQAEALLKSTFSEAARITSITLPLQRSERDSVRAISKQPFASDTLHLLAATTDEKIIGYAILDNVKGKDQRITYCVIVNEKLTVQDVEILAYREPYGGEVQNKSWLKQFFGKQPESVLRPGREIKNITGATISARSVTLGVKNILTLLRLVESRLPAHQ